MVRSWMLAIMGVALMAAPVSAEVIDAFCWDDGDGAVTMGAWSWSWDGPSETATMNIPETQHWGPAHIFTEFTTDTPLDPYAWIIKEVENDTTFDWTDYLIDVSLDREFTIVTATSPTDWLAPIITQPTLQGEVWMGTIEYNSDGLGTEILIGETGEFGVKVGFEGSTSFCFCLDQIPLPEPSTLSLLALGGLALLRRR